jgi:hypothetical protein
MSQKIDFLLSSVETHIDPTEGEIPKYMFSAELDFVPPVGTIIHFAQDDGGYFRVIGHEISLYKENRDDDYFWQVHECSYSIRLEKVER